MHSNIIMAQFVFHKISHWLEGVNCIIFGWKKRKCSNHLSPQMEKITKIEIMSQNHTQPPLDCATIDTFLDQSLGIMPTVNIKIESPMFVLNGSHIRQLFQKIQIIFFTTGFGFLFFAQIFCVFAFSLTQNMKTCRKPADLKIVFCHFLWLNS